MINAPFQASVGESSEPVANFLQGGGESGKAIRSIDWNLTSLGPISQWPAGLQTCIRIMFSSPQPIFIWWGEQKISFYNDACIQLLQGKHPTAMGRPASELFRDKWTELEEKINLCMQGGSAPQSDPLFQLIHRDSGYKFFGSPLPGPSVAESGIMCIGAPLEPKELFFDRTDITLFCRQVLEQFDKVVQDAGLTLILSLAPVSAEVYINRPMWEQMMLTLLTNAVRHTQNGAIAVRLSQEKDRICFAVQDSGIGMTGSLIDAIKESFAEPDIHLAKGLQGLNAIVRLHGGEIEINSHPGVGSTFTVCIPVGKHHLPKEQLRIPGSLQAFQLNNEEPMLPSGNLGISVERLRETFGNTHYRQVLDCLPAAVYTCDKEGRILLYNKAAAQLWGRVPNATVDKWCGSWKLYMADGVTPLPLDESPMARAVKEERPVRGDVIVIERPDGTKRSVTPYPDPLFDPNGRIYGAVNMLVDITEQRLAETQGSRLAAIVESSDDAIISKDLNSIITSWNPAAEQLFGYTAAEMIGTSITRVIPEDKLDEEVSILKQIRAGKRVEHFQTKRITKDGRLLDLSLTISPVKDLKGNIVGASKIARDITEQRRLFMALQESEAKYMQLAVHLEGMVELRTRELVEANAFLEKSNQELEQFAYVTSHDLQEPLRKIHTFAGILYNVNKELLSDSSRMYLEKVIQSAKRMSQLINELLDYSRLVHVKEPFVETDLNEILKNVLTDFEVTINQGAVEIAVDHLPTLTVSPLQMNQLLHNLIGNALKFLSPDRQGLVQIYSRFLTQDEVMVLPDLDPLQKYYLISITDNGIGFDQIYAEKIFQIFQRLNDRNAYEGTGIGLALCRKIVLNHKGIIYATSAVNEGASFNVVLPAV